jgi:hypothetical protein
METYEPALIENYEEVMEAAAKGDWSAQMRMVDHVIARANAGYIPRSVALGAAEVFASLASLSGDIMARRKLAGVLMMQAESMHDHGYGAMSRLYQVEAVAMMSGLADDGDKQAGALLAEHAGAFSPDVLKLADELARSVATATDGDTPTNDTIH